MDSKNLTEKRDDLEKKLKRKEATHYAKPYWHNEGSYQDSVKEIKDIYEELFKVSEKLGSPIPVWF